MTLGSRLQGQPLHGHRGRLQTPAMLSLRRRHAQLQSVADQAGGKLALQVVLGMPTLPFRHAMVGCQASRRTVRRACVGYASARCVANQRRVPSVLSHRYAAMKSGAAAGAPNWHSRLSHLLLLVVRAWHLFWIKHRLSPVPGFLAACCRFLFRPSRYVSETTCAMQYVRAAATDPPQGNAGGRCLRMSLDSSGMEQRDSPLQSSGIFLIRSDSKVAAGYRAAPGSLAPATGPQASAPDDFSAPVRTQPAP